MEGGGTQFKKGTAVRQRLIAENGLKRLKRQRKDHTKIRNICQGETVAS